MSNRFQNFLSVLLTLSAVAIAGTVVYDRLRPANANTEASSEPHPVESWDDMLDRARWIGPKNATVKIVEFIDFECPFCAQFHADIEPLLARYPRDVALALVHYPLPMHRQATAAARAANCADEQGRLPEMTSRLFAFQDSLGVVPWVQIAKLAGVADTAAFTRCLTTGDLQVLALELRAFAAQSSVSATPTIIINGWQFPVPPTPEKLATLVDDIRAGRPVFGN